MRALHQTPIRTCMGCGGRDAQAALLRVLCEPGGNLAVVRGRQHKGRCGYLHSTKECGARFAGRKGSLRSLRRTVDRAAREAFIAGLQLQDSGVVRG